MISILTPTRWRPELTERFAQSIEDTNTGTQVELLLYIDADDETYPAYKELERFSFVRVIQGRAQSISRSWNDLADVCKGDMIMMGNDDLVCITKDWVEHVYDAAEHFEDGIFVMWLNDDFKKHEHCAFPIVSRKWFDTVKYFTPPFFEFGYNDTWLMDIAGKLDRLHYIDGAVVAHRHFTHPTDPSPRDRTTEHARRNSIAKRDGELFALLEPVRDRDVTLLRQQITSAATGSIKRTDGICKWAVDSLELDAQTKDGQ